EIGGFAALVDCLADDYQLGHRLARRGYRVAISPVVVECWSAPMGWMAVWKHQLRWARTIRVCQPVPYFFSILNNATLWPLLWLVAQPAWLSFSFFVGCLLCRVASALHLQSRLLAGPHLAFHPPSSLSVHPPSSLTHSASRTGSGLASSFVLRPSSFPCWLVPVKDLLQAALWLLAFLGNRIEWRGQRLRLRRDGTLE